MSWKIKYFLDWKFVSIIDNDLLCLCKYSEKKKLILFYSKFKYRIHCDSLQGNIDHSTAFPPMHAQYNV